MLAWMITRFTVFIPLGMRHTHRKYDLNVLISVTLSSIKNEFRYIEHFMSTSVIGGGRMKMGMGAMLKAMSFVLSPNCWLREEYNGLAARLQSKHEVIKTKGC